MKVKNLIAILASANPEAEVVVAYDTYSDDAVTTLEAARAATYDNVAWETGDVVLFCYGTCVLFGD